MAHSSDKFLINFFRNFNDRQLFFLVWAIVAGTFVAMIIGYQRRVERRNFREDGGEANPKAKPRNEMAAPGTGMTAKPGNSVTVQPGGKDLSKK